MKRVVLVDKNQLMEKFNKFENKIKEDTFQQNKGLGNDIGYYIFDYNPKLEKYIQEHHLDNHMIFIRGIGKIYPIVRAQDILNNLDINNVPLVLFYPGKYTGNDLLLFDEIEDSNYYRALSFERV